MNCKLNYTEFLAATIETEKYLNKEKLWSLFKYFDARNQNYLEIQDLDEAFRKGGCLTIL